MLSISGSVVRGAVGFLLAAFVVDVDVDVDVDVLVVGTALLIDLPCLDATVLAVGVAAFVLVVETAVVTVGALDELCVGAAAALLAVVLCGDGPIAAPIMTRATKLYETMAAA